MFTIHRNEKGFTLIELVIIIVILGILAAVAIPKYQDMSAQAKEAALRGSVGNLRSAITIFYANQAVTTGIATWPTLAQLTTFNTVLATSVPRNPYQLTTNAPDSVVIGVTPGTIVGARGGWAYDAITGQIWANTSTIGENLW